MIRAKCDLSIELDQGQRHFRPGEPITGQVRVRVGAETKCDGLRLDWQWRTHGRGNRASGPEAGVELFRGTWRPGTYTYRFELTCPSQPTYHGTLLNIDWYLDARADVPWAIDAKTSLDFFVEPPPERGYELVCESLETSAADSTLSPIVLALFWIPGLAMLGVGLVEDPGFLFGAGVWLLVVLVLTWIAAKEWLAKSAFSRFEPKLSGGLDGQPLVVELDYASNKRVNAVEALLIAQEVVVKGSGTNETTHRHDVYRSGTREVVGSIGQNRLRFELVMPEPREIGWSFEASDNELDWFVRLALDVESWPDFEERIDLLVRPGLVDVPRGP